MSFAKEVWAKLSQLDVNEKTEKQQNLTYLSWAWAWAEFMKLYPESEYIIHDEKYFTDGTCEVSVTVTVKDGDKQLTRFMWLPVIDHRNKAIVNPNSFDINKNKMRCLVKCLAMFGLGLYIYAGEDLPEEQVLSVADIIQNINSCINEEQLTEWYKYGVSHHKHAKDAFIEACKAKKGELQNDTKTD